MEKQRDIPTERQIDIEKGRSTVKREGEMEICRYFRNRKLER
jgi:hypothetical protein